MWEIKSLKVAQQRKPGQQIAKPGVKSVALGQGGNYVTTSKGKQAYMCIIYTTYIPQQ